MCSYAMKETFSSCAPSSFLIGVSFYIMPHLVCDKHIIYHSSILIMASSVEELICPRYKTHFFSKRALTVHLNSESCRNLSLWGLTSKSTNVNVHLVVMQNFLIQFLTTSTNAIILDCLEMSSVFPSIHHYHT